MNKLIFRSLWGIWMGLMCLPALAQEKTVRTPSKSTPLIDSLLHLLPTTPADSHKVILYKELCWNYRNLDLVSSIHYGKRGIALAKQLKLPKKEAEITRFIGLAYRHHFFFDESLAWYRRALDLSVRLNDIVGIGFCYDNLGVTRYTQKQYNEALTHFQNALRHFEKVNHLEGLSYAYTHISWVLVSQQDYTQALKFAQKALDIRKKSKASNEQISNAIVDVFNAQMGLKDYTAAEQNLLEAFRLGRTTGKPVINANLLLSLSELYLAKGDINNAYAHLVQSYQLSKSANHHYQRMKCAELLTKIMAQKGNFSSAFQFQTEYYRLKDSLFNAEINNKTSVLEAKYQYDLRERALIEAQKREDLEYRRNLDRERFLSSLLIAALLFVGLVTYFIYQKRKQDKLINEELTRKNSEISRQNQEIQLQTQELAENNQFKDRLFSIISHDLRSPVVGLVGTLDLVNEGLLSDAEFREMLPDLTHNVNSIQGLLDNLLAWARTQMKGISVNPEAFHVYELMSEKIRLLTKQAQLKNIQFVNLIEKDLQVLADKNMIDLVARNLLSNAIKFSNDHGTITLSSKRFKGYSEICIEDNGIGIAEDTLNKLFGNQNISTKGTAGEMGTGLGLRLSKEFVEHNGGAIWAESKLGQGSKFYFTIPE